MIITEQEARDWGRKTQRLANVLQVIDEMEAMAVERGENRGVAFERWRGKPSYWIDRLRSAASHVEGGEDAK